MKTAMVTGGAGGLGRALCKAFIKKGYNVCALDVKPFDQNGSYTYRQVNICDSDNIVQALSDMECPDVLVNCAGITRDRVSWKMSIDEWQAVIDVNLTGAFNMIRYFGPNFKSRGSGVVINISSINATRGKFGQTNYVASKAGLEGLTRNLAIELGKFGIRINAVAPGMVETEMTKNLPEEVLKRAENERSLPYGVKPIDVANTVLFLCSEKARCITGQTIRVDSGQLITF